MPNSTGPITRSKHPIWSHLRALQIGSWHSDPESLGLPATSDSRLDGLLKSDQAPHNFKRIADGVALLADAYPGGDNVAVCAVELGGAIPERLRLIIRIAQKRFLTYANVDELQDLVNKFAKAVDKYPRTDWTQQGPVAADNSREITRDILVVVTRHCLPKISEFVLCAESTQFVQWAASVDYNVFGSAQDRELASEALSGITQAICQPSGTSGEDAKRLAHAIHCANAILSNKNMLLVFQDGWRDVADRQASFLAYAEEDVENAITESRRAHPPIHQLLYGLQRYYNACRDIIRGLGVFAATHDRETLGYISVQTPPLFKFTPISVTPGLDGEYPSLQEYLETNFGVKPRDLDPKKMKGLCAKWSKAYSSTKVKLHPELQLALFYAVNPDKHPIDSYIGVSRQCCWLCEYVLRALQKTPVEGDDSTLAYSGDIAGSPIQLDVRGTSGEIFMDWRFPEPDHIPPAHRSVSSADFDKICRRFSIVRSDLSSELKKKAEKVIPYLMR